MKNLEYLLEQVAENKTQIINLINAQYILRFSQSSRIVSELKSGMLIIPWLPLSVENIDLKNGNFWESSVFTDKEKGLNIEWKRNIVKFVNKIISWNIDEPVAVESIASWLFQVDPLMLKNDILKSAVANKMGWNYSKVMENLKKDNEV